MNEVGVPHVYVHSLGDRRDTAPHSAAGYARELRAFVEKLSVGEVATVMGRYYAMDRDKCWERVQIAIYREWGGAHCSIKGAYFGWLAAGCS